MAFTAEESAGEAIFRGRVEAQKVQQVVQEEDASEDHRRVDRRVPGHLEAEGHLRLDHRTEEEQKELGEQHPQQQPAQDAEEGGEYRLPKEEPGQMPLLHAQDVVEPQLLLPPLHEEAVGVAEEGEGEEGNHNGPEAQEPLDRVDALQGIDAPVHVQKQDVVEHGRADHAGEKVRQIELAVEPQRPKGQLGKEADLMHGRSPRWS